MNPVNHAGSTTEERIAIYETRGRSIRESRVKPSYVRDAKSGSLHDTLGTWYDPIYYLTGEEADVFLNNHTLNVRMGILDEAYRLHGSDMDIPWYHIDWECVPMISEAVEQAYLAHSAGSIAASNWLLDRYKFFNPSLSSYTLPYIATIYQNATYILPNLFMTYNGSGDSTIPRMKDLVSQWAKYTLDQDTPYVLNVVREYFGLQALIDNKKPYLKIGDTVSFPDFVTNEVLLCREREPRHFPREITKTLGYSIAILYAKVLDELKNPLVDSFIEEAEKLLL